MHGVMTRLDVLHACVSTPEVLTAAPAHGFELIVTNPPYIKTCEWQDLQPEVKTWESREALDGGEDGLDVVRMILSASLYVEQPAAHAHERAQVGLSEQHKLARLTCNPAATRSERNDHSHSSILKAGAAIWMELDVDQPVFLQERMQDAAGVGAWWSVGVETSTVLENGSQSDRMCVKGGEKIDVEAVFEDFTGRARFCKLTKGCKSAR